MAIEQRAWGQVRVSEVLTRFFCAPVRHAGKKTGAASRAVFRQ